MEDPARIHKPTAVPTQTMITNTTRCAVAQGSAVDFIQPPNRNIIFQAYREAGFILSTDRIIGRHRDDWSVLQMAYVFEQCDEPWSETPTATECMMQ
jgi:hypothetical protein